ncbi:hypothetical protein DFP72DRAFT_991074 [Ephemerocybe angulata]|uniref:C2H2-type domain-containing protein n=1 Tax=Ephemerocybe angulata TaxID=980116 RepID=A0A8H6HTG0_9AGAR|nr:hypothetical protein DFP72DRAFT_991074 [Tulosesus angulatus]
MPPRSRNSRQPIASRLPCTVTGCHQTFASQQGRTKHVRSLHRSMDGHIRAPIPRPLVNVPAEENMELGGGFEDGQGAQGAPFGPEQTPEPEVPDSPSTEERPKGVTRHPHPYLTGSIYDERGRPLPKGSAPPPLTNRKPDDWTPFEDSLQFCIADFLYRREEMSQENINTLLNLWGLSVMQHGATFGPFDNYKHIFDTIDDIEQGDAPWMCMKVSINEELDETAQSWKKKEYELWFRDPDVVLSNMLSNPDFDGQFDYQPYVEVDENNKRRWSDYMSGNYSWRQADAIYEADKSTRGATYVSIVLGADKTTVSVGTGDTEYHPLYLTIGNVHNNVRRGHRSAVVPIAFLAIPKGDRQHDNDADFRRFKSQLYHSSIAAIFETVKKYMTTPVLRRCPDGHFRRIIFDFGAFIADYPEQVMLAGVVQNWCCRCTALPSDIDGIGDPRTNELLDRLLEVPSMTHQKIWDEYGFNTSVIPFTRDYPRAEIYKILSSDLLHQVIKGTFKDHLVTWVEEYLNIAHEKADANAIMDEIDRRLAAVPPFSGPRQGRRFKQWTGDDSKALMKIYIAAIKGLVPPEVVKCFTAFMDFCYIVRRNDLDTDALAMLKDALKRFHQYREFFRTYGVRGDGFSLPRQHSLVHYADHIRNFGAPNGLCSSITESRHITAVKKPWRRSNRYQALGQMLLINQRLDKLALARTHYTARGMLRPEHSRLLAPIAPVKVSKPGHEDDEDEDDEAGGAVDGERVLADVKLARTRPELGEKLGIDDFPSMLETFLRGQLGYNDSDDEYSDDEDDRKIDYISSISTYRSAVATFYAPSDICGIRGMRREWIRCTPSWRKGGPRRDCVYLVEDDSKPGFRGLNVVRVKAFMSFNYGGTEYPCAAVEWFKKVGRHPDGETGMWIVKPDMSSGERDVTVVHIDSILRSAHLIPVYGSYYPTIPPDYDHNESLDDFQAYHVNKYIDHHANEIAF